jgi:hypothetical protein
MSRLVCSASRRGVAGGECLEGDGFGGDEGKTGVAEQICLGLGERVQERRCPEVRWL